MCSDGDTNRCETQTGNSHSLQGSQLTFLRERGVSQAVGGEESWDESLEAHKDPQGLLGQTPPGTLGSRNSNCTGANSRNQEPLTRASSQLCL